MDEFVKVVLDNENDIEGVTMKKKMKDFLKNSDILEAIKSCKKFLTENPPKEITENPPTETTENSPTETNNLLEELKNYFLELDMDLVP